MIKWCWMESDRRPTMEEMLFFLKGLSENIDELYAESEEHDKHDIHSTPHQPLDTQPLQTRPNREELQDKNISKVNDIVEASSCSTSKVSEKERNTAEISEKLIKDDLEVTAIVDEHHDIPVTIILSESSQENELRRTVIKDDLDQEHHEWSTPITHIGGPSDGLTEYEERLAQDVQKILEPLSSNSDSVIITECAQRLTDDTQKFAEPSSSSSDSVIIEDCPSGYVVLPGERLRRKSSIRRAHAQVRYTC